MKFSMLSSVSKNNDNVGYFNAYFMNPKSFQKLIKLPPNHQTIKTRSKRNIKQGNSPTQFKNPHPIKSPLMQKLNRKLDKTKIHMDLKKNSEIRNEHQRHFIKFTRVEKGEIFFL
jgi:hypothetical protein